MKLFNGWKAEWKKRFKKKCDSHLYTFVELFSHTPNRVTKDTLFHLTKLLMELI